MAERARTPLQRRVVTWIPFVWLFVFFLAPFAIVFKISLSEPTIAQPPYVPVFNSVGEVPEKIDQLSAANYEFVFEPPDEQPPFFDWSFSSLYDWVRHYTSSLYIRALLSSLWIAAVSTLLTLLIGYPIAYGMARAKPSIRPLLVMLVILPFWTSFLIRVYAWIGILKPEGLLNQALLFLGLIDQPLTITNTNTAVYIGIVYSYLPFMVLPLYAALERLDHTLLEAAADLGSPPLRSFWQITFPLSLPGVIAGSLLVFIPAVGEFVIPDLLGGSETLMIGRTLWNEFFLNRDWPVASAVAIVLLILLVVPIVFFQNAQARVREAK
jgi:putrescine transport system permease protein